MDLLKYHKHKFEIFNHFSIDDLNNYNSSEIDIKKRYINQIINNKIKYKYIYKILYIADYYQYIDMHKLIDYIHMNMLYNKWFINKSKLNYNLNLLIFGENNSLINNNCNCDLVKYEININLYNYKDVIIPYYNLKHILCYHKFKKIKKYKNNKNLLNKSTLIKHIIYHNNLDLIKILVNDKYKLYDHIFAYSLYLKYDKLSIYFFEFILHYNEFDLEKISIALLGCLLYDSNISEYIIQKINEDVLKQIIDNSIYKIKIIDIKKHANTFKLANSINCITKIEQKLNIVIL